MLKILFAGCFGLSPAISAQFILKMCAAGQNCKKITKALCLWGSRSFKVIDVGTLESVSAVQVLVTISNKSELICNCFHAWG